MSLKSKCASLLVLLSAVACGSANEINPRIGISKASKGGPTTTAPTTPAPTTPAPVTSSPVPGGGGGGGGGGGSVTTPAPADAASQTLSSSGSTTGSSPDIDFGTLQNQTTGGIPVGSSRSAQEFVTNTSKKTALVISSISIVGTNPNDFSVDPISVAAALSSAIPANKNAAAVLNVTFTPTDAGVRTGTLQVVSNAGTATATLTGVGIALPPVLDAIPPLNFLSDSAPDGIIIQNSGGSTLVLQSFSFVGANPESFAITVANSGQSNCFAGILLAPTSFCFLGVGVAPGATGPSTATLAILSSDPASPEMDVPLTLTPDPNATPVAPTPVPVDPAPVPVDPTPVP
jgi:hypothetical protein